MVLECILSTHLKKQNRFATYILYFKDKKLPLLELAIVAAIASAVASVTTDTSNGAVQSKKWKNKNIRFIFNLN